MLQQTLNTMETPYDNLNDEELVKMLNYISKETQTSIDQVIKILKASYLYYVNNIHDSLNTQ